MTTTSVEEKALPRWDLTNVYPGLDSPEFAAAFKELIKQIDSLESYLQAERITQEEAPAEGDAAKSAEVIGEYLDRANALRRLYGTLYAFVHSFVSTDSYNDAAKKNMSKLDRQNVRLKQISTQFQAWLGRRADALEDILPQNEVAQAHAFYLQEIAEQSRYLMSADEESLAAELAPSGGFAWTKLQGTVVSQLKVDFEEAGEMKTIPVTSLINYRNHPDEGLRRRAYEAELAAWRSVEEPIAAALNGVKGNRVVLDRRRGRQDNLHSALDAARIDRPTLEAMLEAMQQSFPTFRRYFKAKARRLGKQKLAWWDLFAPSGSSDRSLTYEEAGEFVMEHFSRFSPDLAAFAQQAIASHWIDVGPRDGKRAGAFCMPVIGLEESRILLNFDGSLDSVFTLAHELGHGFHNSCMIGKTPLQRINPMTLAETASIMCETIVIDAALAQAESPGEELAILETSLIGDAQVIVDIYSRYLFEQAVFERRAQSELSAADFCELMEASQKAAYGEGLDERTLNKYMWTWKPHYYGTGLSFYNFPYAFGLLFGIGLYAIYQQRGSDFVPDYKNLLASTGQADAATLAARFDIDIRSKTFWQDSLNVIAKRIDRYVEL